MDGRATNGHDKNCSARKGHFIGFRLLIMRKSSRLDLMGMVTEDVKTVI